MRKVRNDSAVDYHYGTVDLVTLNRKKNLLTMGGNNKTLITLTLRPKSARSANATLTYFKYRAASRMLAVARTAGPGHSQYALKVEKE